MIIQIFSYFNILTFYMQHLNFISTGINYILFSPMIYSKHICNGHVVSSHVIPRVHSKSLSGPYRNTIWKLYFNSWGLGLYDTYEVLNHMWLIASIVRSTPKSSQANVPCLLAKRFRYSAMTFMICCKLHILH